MNFDKQYEAIKSRQGFIAALDQSGGSSPKALQAYGISKERYKNDAEMFDLIHEMRARIATSKPFQDGRVIGAILFEDTMLRSIAGQPTAQYLSGNAIVPFLKIDKGLEEEADGVQLLKPIPDLGARCERARTLGVFGTKMRSVIQKPDAKGIREIVAQQFEIGAEIINQGLVPILEPEVNIFSQDAAQSERILHEELSKALSKHSLDLPVMLKLSLPQVPNFYKEFIEDPKVLRVAALSGGYCRKDAVAHLQDNPQMIASFSRALIEGLSADQTDEEFESVLDGAIGMISAASR